MDTLESKTTSTFQQRKQGWKRFIAAFPRNAQQGRWEAEQAFYAVTIGEVMEDQDCDEPTALDWLVERAERYQKSPHVKAGYACGILKWLQQRRWCEPDESWGYKHVAPPPSPYAFKPKEPPPAETNEPNTALDAIIDAMGEDEIRRRLEGFPASLADYNRNGLTGNVRARLEMELEDE